MRHLPSPNPTLPRAPQVIPYLTVYAVLPSSLIFLYLYSTASQHMSRATLFNAIISIFLGFFLVFGFFLYPNHGVLHPHELADRMTTVRVLAGALSDSCGGLEWKKSVGWAQQRE